MNHFTDKCKDKADQICSKSTRKDSKSPTKATNKCKKSNRDVDADTVNDLLGINIGEKNRKTSCDKTIDKSRKETPEVSVKNRCRSKEKRLEEQIREDTLKDNILQTQQISSKHSLQTFNEIKIKKKADEEVKQYQRSELINPSESSKKKRVKKAERKESKRNSGRATPNVNLSTKESDLAKIKKRRNPKTPRCMVIKELPQLDKDYSFCNFDCKTTDTDAQSDNTQSSNIKFPKSRLTLYQKSPNRRAYLPSASLPFKVHRCKKLPF